jgi:hypothetical protein
MFGGTTIDCVPLCSVENCPYQQKPGVQLLTDLEQSTVKPVTKMGYGRRLPLAFVNQPVVEACTLCLLQVVMETESVSVYTLPVPV